MPVDVLAAFHSVSAEGIKTREVWATLVEEYHRARPKDGTYSIWLDSVVETNGWVRARRTTRSASAEDQEVVAQKAEGGNVVTLEAELEGNRCDLPDESAKPAALPEASLGGCDLPEAGITGSYELNADEELVNVYAYPNPLPEPFRWIRSQGELLVVEVRRTSRAEEELVVHETKSTDNDALNLVAGDEDHDEEWNEELEVWIPRKPDGCPL